MHRFTRPPEPEPESVPLPSLKRVNGLTEVVALPLRCRRSSASLVWRLDIKLLEVLGGALQQTKPETDQWLWSSHRSERVVWSRAKLKFSDIVYLWLWVGYKEGLIYGVFEDCDIVFFEFFQLLWAETSLFFLTRVSNFISCLTELSSVLWYWAEQNFDQNFPP